MVEIIARYYIALKWMQNCQNIFLIFALKHVAMNTPNFLINEQTRINVYGENIFFIYHMKNESLVDFLIC